MNTSKRIFISCLLLTATVLSGCRPRPQLNLNANQAGTNTPAPTTTLASVQPTPIPGWKMFAGGGAELWLPQSYEGGDLATDLDVIFNRLSTLGPEYKRIADLVKSNPTAYSLLIYDMNVGQDGYISNVTVAKEQALSVLTIDTYADAIIKQLPSSFTVEDRKKVDLDHYKAVRLWFHAAIDRMEIDEVIFVIKEKGFVWAVIYATGSIDLPERLPIIEQSANTFRVQP